MMFTGIVEGLGRVLALELAADGSGARLEVEAPWLVGGLGLGDSVAVDGCCLTVTELRGDGFTADVMAESLRRTALGRLGPGSAVNLERPLALGDRLGGHLVQGHVDGLGLVLERRPLGAGPGGEQSEELRIGLDPELGRYIVSKGSIAINGVSLTVAASGPDWFAVALIPHTLAVTNLGGLERGDQVQLEVDVLAKYVERLLEPRLAAVGGGGATSAPAGGERP
jgi:riboflavin synthase